MLRQLKSAASAQLWFRCSRDSNGCSSLGSPESLTKELWKPLPLRVETCPRQLLLPTGPACSAALLQEWLSDGLLAVHIREQPRSKVRSLQKASAQSQCWSPFCQRLIKQNPFPPPSHSFLRVLPSFFVLPVFPTAFFMSESILWEGSWGRMF